MWLKMKAGSEKVCGDWCPCFGATDSDCDLEGRVVCLAEDPVYV